jgi:glucose-6-phosphate isomerase
LREGVPNFFATFIEVLRDRPAGQDWELEPGVTCGDYLFGMLQVRKTIYIICNHSGCGKWNP